MSSINSKKSTAYTSSESQILFNNPRQENTYREYWNLNYPKDVEELK